MKITKLTYQLKRAGRCSVFIDDEFYCGIPDWMIIDLGLVKGKELTQDEADQLMQLSIEAKVYDRAINYLSIRSRSLREMRQYLKEKTTIEGVGEKIVSRLVEQGYLDDAAFARAWVSSRRAVKPRSKRQLQAELQQKGVASEIIQEVLEDFAVEDELDQLTILVAKKRQQSRYQDDKKLLAYFARQGYGYDQIKKAMGDGEARD